MIALEARPSLIAALSGRADVAQIRPDERIALQRPQLQATSASAPGIDPLWSLAMIRADLASSALGLDGAGVVVANLDTGVDWQHPALLAKYRGYRGQAPAIHRGNWHVSTQEPYSYPGDGGGHGTHTMGTMVGDDGAGNRTGVAPGARWIAVKLFDNGGFTYESWIHDAFQWVMAPEGDPALAPDIVNNSWGTSDGADGRYRSDIAALRAAGILPIFSAGNDGPNPKSVGAPGSYTEALTVGAWTMGIGWHASPAVAPAHGATSNRMSSRRASMWSRPFRVAVGPPAPARAWPRRMWRAWPPCSGRRSHR